MTTLDQIQIDAQLIQFTNQNQVSVIFANEFSTVPQVLASPQGNVNVWLSNITTLGVDVHTSVTWTGSIHVNAMGSK